MMSPVLLIIIEMKTVKAVPILLSECYSYQHQLRTYTCKLVFKILNYSGHVHSNVFIIKFVIIDGIRIVIIYLHCSSSSSSFYSLLSSQRLLKRLYSLPPGHYA